MATESTAGTGERERERGWEGEAGGRGTGTGANGGGGGGGGGGRGMRTGEAAGDASAAVVSSQRDRRECGQVEDGARLGVGAQSVREVIAARLAREADVPLAERADHQPSVVDVQRRPHRVWLDALRQLVLFAELTLGEALRRPLLVARFDLQDVVLQDLHRDLLRLEAGADVDEEAHHALALHAREHRLADALGGGRRAARR